MRVKTIQDEDFVNYKTPSMFIALGTCNWKCCLEAGIPISICQNSELALAPDIYISDEEIYNRYINNNITKSIVIGGLEPMTMAEDVIGLLKYFRNNGCEDPFVIYTGYYPNEISSVISRLSQFKSVIVKFGRFVPNHKPHFDPILGVNLISDNQFARCFDQ